MYSKKMNRYAIPLAVFAADALLKRPSIPRTSTVTVACRWTSATDIPVENAICSGARSRPKAAPNAEGSRA